MEIIIIVAVDEQMAIGVDGDQPAYISADLKRFKQLTTGYTVVMGRKTFEALPKGALPNRRNIVMTRKKELQLPGCEMAHNVEEVIQLCNNDEKVFIIGGGEIYNSFLPKANRLLITKIYEIFENTDTWFPKIDATQWKLHEESEVLTDEKSGLSYQYQHFERK